MDLWVCFVVIELYLVLRDENTEKGRTIIDFNDRK